jgi:hypothetical protein
MKSRLLLLIGLVIFSQVAMAQFRLGIKGGVNMTKIDGKSFSEEFETGYHLGGFAEIGLGKRFSIQPEVLFNQYNTRTDSSFKDIYQVGPETFKDVKLNYLAIPIMLNYKLGSLISLQAGPQFGILMSDDNNLLENGKAAFTKGEFALAGGAQLNLSNFRISGRYFVGLNNISDISDQEKWTNQGLQLSVGLAF